MSWHILLITTEKYLHKHYVIKEPRELPGRGSLKFTVHIFTFVSIRQNAGGKRYRCEGDAFPPELAVGSNGRNKGSIHSDIWHGTAAELANSNIIAIYPVIGWWRERAHLERWNHRSRYSLIVSINTSAENIDIYTPVAIKLGIFVPTTV
jgi:hypothetical protein